MADENQEVVANKKPKVFIGSSSEGVDIAEAVFTSLERVAECTIWNQGVFELGKSTLESIYSFIEQFDFALLIVTPDDKVEIRENNFTSARDNVIFELGLFMGGLGLDRVIFVTGSPLSDFHLPSDLSGITHAVYDASRVNDNILAAVGSACLAIKSHIKKKSLLDLSSRSETGNQKYVGAICFRIVGDDIQYLLVSSTQARHIFPKGHVRNVDRNIRHAAIRLARKEAGARGRLLDSTLKSINYFNEEANAINRIEILLYETTQIFDVEASFRKPTWHGLSDAITAVTKNRDYNSSYELARIFELADSEIRKSLIKAIEK